MLNNKKNVEIIQPFSYRKNIIENFCSYIKPNLNVIIYEINDMYGPSIDKNLNIDNIILS